MKVVPILMIFLTFILGSCGLNRSPRGCEKKLDIFFVTGGIILENDNKILQRSLAGMIDSFHIVQGGNRMGFGFYSQKETFTANLFDNQCYLKKRIVDMSYLIGSARTYLGLENLIEELENNGRKGVPKVGVVISIGLSKDWYATKLLAILAKANGINMFSVGVGFTDERELKEIASDPNQVVIVDSLEELPTKLSNLVQQVCSRLV